MMDLSPELLDFARYLEQECGVAKNTAAAYLSDLKHFRNYIAELGISHLSEFSAEHLADFLEQHQKEKKNQSDLSSLFIFDSCIFSFFENLSYD